MNSSDLSLIAHTLDALRNDLRNHVLNQSVPLSDLALDFRLHAAIAALPAVAALAPPKEAAEWAFAIANEMDNLYKKGA